MSNEIFGVDIAAAINDAFAGNLHPLTLYKISRGIGEYGEIIEAAATYQGEGVRSKWDSRTVVNRGWPIDTVKLTVLQNGIPDPLKGDQVEILGDRWRILDIEQDPVNATWSLAGVLEVGAPPSIGTIPPTSSGYTLPVRYDATEPTVDCLWIAPDGRVVLITGSV